MSSAQVDFVVDALYGAMVGSALGLTGGGGSIITLPILVYLVGENVHDAVGTSLAVVGGIALQGFYGQRERLDWKTGLALGLLGAIGSVPGAIASQAVPERALLMLFAAVMVIAAAAMLRGRRAPHRDERPAPNLAAVALAGIGLGFMTGFLGVGGGFLIVPTLMLALRFSIQRAIPTSLLVIALNALASLAAHAATAHVHWDVVALFLAGGTAGNAAGALGARALDQHRLKQIFAVFVIGIAAFTAGSAAGIVPIRVH